MIVCLILHLEEERMFVGKNIVEGNNKKRKKAQKVAKLVSTNHNINTSLHEKKKKKKRICWCLLWCLLKFWSITGLLQKSMLLKNELKRRNIGCWIGRIGWINELVDWWIWLLRCWLVGCLIEEWMEFDNKMLLIKRNI